MIHLLFLATRPLSPPKKTKPQRVFINCDVSWRKRHGDNNHQSLDVHQSTKNVNKKYHFFSGVWPASCWIPHQHLPVFSMDFHYSKVLICSIFFPSLSLDEVKFTTGSWRWEEETNCDAHVFLLLQKIGAQKNYPLVN